MVPELLPEAFRGAWDLSEEACSDEQSLTRVEVGSNWLRDNLGLGALQFFTSVTPMLGYSDALEARFIMGGNGGIRDQQVLLNLKSSSGKRELLWFDGQGIGDIDDAATPVELVACSKVQGGK